MEGKLEKEDLYENSLRKVRSMPQTTDAEREEKRIEARILRMNIMLDNAMIMEYIVFNIEKNPNITEEEIWNMIKDKSRYKAHPETIKAFVEELIDRIKKFKIFLEKPDPNLTARDLFEDLSYGQEPKDLVVLDTTDTFAVTLWIKNAEDFKKTDDRGEKIDGFYNNKALVRRNTIYNRMTIPIIVIGPEGNEIAKEHEKGHFHNSIFASLSGINKRTFWLKMNNDDIELLRKKYQLLQNRKSKKKITHKEIIKSFKPLIHKILDEAKDEILADLYATFSFDYINNLTIKDDVYDYFDQITYDMNISSYIKNRVWNEYVRILLEQTEEVQWLLYIYNRFGMEGRVILLRSVLGQIPLYKWEEQMTSSGFHEEALLLEQILNDEKMERKKDKIIYYIKEHPEIQDQCIIPKIKELLEEDEDRLITSKD